MRAAFRLSESCIDATSILAAQLGIKQKSVFDHLMEDAQVFIYFIKGGKIVEEFQVD